MVVETGEGRYGFVVDRVLGNCQTVIKNLGRFYRHVQVVSGATILGNGTVALILDPERLAQDAVRSTLAASRGPAAAVKRPWKLAGWLALLKCHQGISSALDRAPAPVNNQPAVSRSSRSGIGLPGPCNRADGPSGLSGERIQPKERTEFHGDSSGK
jgi:hypothetical protein